MRRYQPYVPHAAVLALLVAAAACTDRGGSPLGPEPPGGEPVEPDKSLTFAVQCTSNVAARSVTCAPPPASSGAAAGDIIVGSQGTYVQVTTSNVAYNGGTGQFTFDMTLQNLIEQPIGTTDGTVAHPAGNRVFLHSGPTVTSGAGVAAVFPDGFGTFTAAGQPYYAYVGMLAQSQVSATRSWTFIISPTVLTFDFTLYVSAPVEYPDGYITLDGQLPGYAYGNLHPGDTEALAAVIKTAVGTPVAGTVTFGTTDPLCATVDGGGVVTGVRAATCQITATAGLRTGSMSFDVTGAVRTWDGSQSADWSDGLNWVGDLTPAAVDSVLIPTGVPNFPALVAATAIGGVQVDDGATLSLGAFDLTASQNVATGYTVGSGILGTTGSLVLAGTGKTVMGRVPITLVTGTYSLAGNLFGVAPETIDDGRLDSDSYEIGIDSQ
ncbi:MAG TPA: hypothetical protein VFX98_13150 [Longimicrobiaceae bacterium]|nr:hypothetical protein [Longimicrobiaceae bacterium]